MMFVGCGSSEPTANTERSDLKNAAITNANAGGSLETTKKEVASTTNEAPTLGPVVRSYYQALRDNDDAALKNVLSSAMVRSIETDMKEEKKTGLAAFLAETDQIPEKPVEVRNEKVEGDKGLAEIRGGVYANWTAIAFVKEGGAWKMSNESPDLQSVTQSSDLAK